MRKSILLVAVAALAGFGLGTAVRGAAGDNRKPAAAANIDVQTIETSTYDGMYRIVDSDKGVICYVVRNSNNQAISMNCLKGK